MLPLTQPLLQTRVWGVPSRAPHPPALGRSCGAAGVRPWGLSALKYSGSGDTSLMGLPSAGGLDRSLCPRSCRRLPAQVSG